MARRGRSKPTLRIVEKLEVANDFTAAHGDYRPEFILHAETGTKARCHLNRESSILEKWMRQGGIGFEQGACNVIRDCQYFWWKMGGQQITANYGERMPKGFSDGMNATDASIQLSHMSKGIPHKYWDVFENVVRHNEPAGYAGSHFATNTPNQITAAKVIVGMVASLIAARLGY